MSGDSVGLGLLLALGISLVTTPAGVSGAVIRVEYLSGPRAFLVVVAAVSGSILAPILLSLG